MTANDIHAWLKERFGEAVGPLSAPERVPSAPVPAERIIEVSRALKTAPGVELDHCDDITGVDWPQRGVIEVVYHLRSYGYRHGIVLKVEAPRAAPEVPSVAGVWKAANWLEREVYDMFGVVFTGHPDLRRILLPDDWEGWPLRKDYQEAGGYHGISKVREDPMAELRRLDLARRARRQRESAGSSDGAPPASTGEPEPR